MMPAQATYLFLFSVLTATACNIYMKSRRSVVSRAADALYHSTLQKLFVAATSKAQQARHAIPAKDSSNESKNSTQPPKEASEARSDYFRGLYNEEYRPNKLKVIHVAGTKGKGSTVEYVAAGLRATTSKVGIFTSPHLHTARERIKIGNRLISKEDMTRLGIDALERMKDYGWTVFFDLLLTMAIRYFGEQDVDYAVLETGIGGRYDSTNFMESPEVSVITSISLDHQAMLGNTVEEIAWQKAGIIKRNGHVFTAATQDPKALEVIKRECEEKKATLHVVPVSSERVRELGLITAYKTQVQNACLSAAVLEFLNVPTGGMKDFFWPCRMEAFSISGTTVVLDGCHNDDSVYQFLTGLKEKYPGRRILVLFGAGMEKHLGEMLRHVVTYADRVLMVQSRHFKSLSEPELVESVPIESRGILVQGSDAAPIARQPDGTVSSRLQLAINSESLTPEESQRDIIAVCGSLFVASEARECLFELYPDLFSDDDWVREPDRL